MRGLSLLLIAVLLSTATFAAEKKLYKWTDAQGVVHYTDQPPPEGAEAEARPLTTEPDSAPAAAPTRPSKGEESATCQQLRRNLKVYSENTDIEADLDGDGQPESLDAATRQSEMDKTRRMIEANCDQPG